MRGFTRFKKTGPSVLAFALDTDGCECCGEIALAPNSVGMRECDALALGLVRWPDDAPLPPELGWCDDFDGAVCPDCYEEIEAEAEAA
jgi:hypothetical protein